MASVTVASDQTTAAHHLGHVARGGALGLAGAAISAGAGFALVVVVARGLDRAEAGVFFAATSVFLILVALATLGTDAGLSRFLLRHEAHGRPDDIRRTLRVAAGASLTAATVLAAGLFLIAGPLATALGIGDSGARLLRITAPLLPVAVAAELCLSGTRAFGNMRPTVLVDRILRSSLQPLAVLLVVVAGGGLLHVAAGWTGAYIVSCLLAGLALRGFLRARLPARTGPGLPVGRDFWSFTWPRGVARLAQIGIQKADILIVAALLGPGPAALYTVATRFVAIGQFATQAISQVLQPRFTAILLSDEPGTLREVHRVATAWSMVLSWPWYLAVGCAPGVYLGLFGSGYGDAAAVAVVVTMASAMLLAVASGPVDTLLLMAGRSRTSLGNAVVALVVDVALCLLLVPVLGLLGAALGWALAVVTRCALAFWQVRRHLGVVSVDRRVLLAGALPLLTVAVPLGSVALLAPGDLAAHGLAGVVALVGYGAGLWRFRESLHLDLLARSVLGPTPGREARMKLRRMTGALRRRLPQRGIRATRWAVLMWGMLTADLRMPPSFIIVGAQRSGTTTLFRLLEAHPALVRPTLSKGTGYFDDDYHRGRRWYLAHFPLRATARWATRASGPPQTFECSGYYMFHPLAARRIARDLPGVKVVAMVRDPVERAYSAHRHERSRGFEMVGFDVAVDLERTRTAGESERLAAEPGYRSFEHRHHSYLGRSEYAGQIRGLVDELGPDRVYVMEADRLFADGVDEFVRLQRWLGTPIWVPDEVPRWNAQPRDPLDRVRRAELERHFESHDRQLAGILGHEPAWRATPR